jgi:hypothetical protein
MKHSKIILSTALLSLVVACGKKSSGGSAPAPVVREPIQSETGYFKADLSPLNSHIAGDITGQATVVIKGGTFKAEVRVKDAPQGVMHAQYIHIADACPTLAADVNKDGIIDATEGAKSYGKVIMPLDGDLSSQLAGLDKFPTSDVAGKYFYSRTASTKKILDDLMAKDKNTKDQFVKMKTSKLSMAGRHLVIYGIPKTTELPRSVAGMYGKSAHEALPIACGTFAKVDALEEGNTSNGSKD